MTRRADLFHAYAALTDLSQLLPYIVFQDLFRDQVGDVTYVELFSDENEKPRGCGILEFGTKDLAKKAVEKMHRHDLKGRKVNNLSLN